MTCLVLFCFCNIRMACVRGYSPVFRLGLRVGVNPRFVLVRTWSRPKTCLVLLCFILISLTSICAILVRFNSDSKLRNRSSITVLNLVWVYSQETLVVSKAVPYFVLFYIYRSSPPSARSWSVSTPTPNCATDLQ